MKASKLVYNNNNWTSVSGLAQTGIWINNNNNKNKKGYYFGLEEWMNNPILRKRKLGYIDSYRRTQRHGVVDRIVLFMINPNDRQIYYVGNLYNVRQLDNGEIDAIRKDLVLNNWLDIVQNDFNNIGDNHIIQNHNQYMQCWNSQQIVAQTGKSFILNIRYDKIEIFPEKSWINLTKINPKINESWKRLIDLYDIPTVWNKYFN